MKQKVSGATREILKAQKGIQISEKANRNCKNCYFYSSRRICSKHYVTTRQDEYCGEFSTNQIKVYRGGSASPK